MSSSVLAQVKKSATAFPSSPIITPFQTLLGHQTSQSLVQAAPTQQNEPATPDRVASPLPASFGHNFTSIPIRATVSETPQTKQETPKAEDGAEHEAEQIAEHITPTATSGSSTAPTPPSDIGSGDDTPSSKRGNDALSHVNQVIDSGNGQPLDSATRASMEQQFGHNFSNVRVYTNTQAATSAQTMNALAYTIGPSIVFNRGQYAPQTETGKRLLAHELTHVVQQSRSLTAPSQPQLFSIAQPQWKQPALQMSTGLASTNSFEREAHQASNAVIRGERINVLGRIEQPWIQRQDIQSAQPAPQAATSNTAQQTQPQTDNTNSESSSWTWAAIEKAAWAAIREYAPDLEPIIHQGVASWLEEKITNALQSAFDTLMAPVRAVTGVVQELSAHFSELLVWMQGAAEKISRGDCSAITEATAKIQQVIDGFASPIIDRIKQIASKVGDFFKGIWDQFGAPIWEWLKKVGGEAWEKLQSFGAWIWDKTAPIRDLGARAWKWLKDKIGIGDTPEGQNGILQWIQRKAGEVWEKLKQKLEPVKKPLMVVGAIILLLSPVGPLIEIGAVVGGLIVGIKWIREHLSTPDGVVNARVMLQKVIIPQIMNSIKGFTHKLTDIAHGITDKLNKVMGGLGNLISAVGQSILSFIVSAIQWIANTFQGLVTWANEKLTTLVNWVTTGLERLHAFLQPVLDVLGKVAEVYIDILKLPLLLAQWVWHKIPACIRDPFVNFLVKQILGRIPIVKSIIAIPNIWEKLKERAMTIIHQIFQKGDLTGAMLSIFKLLLEVLNIPLELVTGIFTKAANAFDLIMKDPIGFLKNILGAIKQGFGLFFQHIGTHLLNGAAEWLFGDLDGKGLKIRIPKEFSLGPIFTFVIDVLGVTAEHIWEKLEKKLDPELVKKLKKGAKALGEAWEWISTLITEGPAGLWKKLTEKLSDLWNTLLNSVIGWINTKIIKGVMIWLLGFLDPTGIMEIIETLKGIYSMIQSAVKYALKLLRVLDTILDSLINIAQGVLGPVAVMFEGVLARIVPVALGFLANLLDIDDIGDSIKDIVDTVREKVDEGLDWLIDKAIALGKGILNALGIGGDDKKEEEKAEKPEGELVAEEFDVAKEHHRVSLTMAGGEPEVMIASTPTKLDQFISGLRDKIQTIMQGSSEAETKEKERLLALLDTASTTAATVQTSLEKDKAQPGQGLPKAQLTEQLHLLVNALRDPIIATAALADYKPGEMKYADIGGRPISASGWVVLNKGGSPKDDVKKPVMDALAWLREQFTPIPYTNFDSGHLIASSLGGSDDKENLVPMQSQVNQSWFRSQEIAIVTPLKNKEKIFLSVLVRYTDTDPFYKLIDERVAEAMKNFVTDNTIPKEQRDELAQALTVATTAFMTIPRSISFTAFKLTAQGTKEEVANQSGIDTRDSFGITLGAVLEKQNKILREQKRKTGEKSPLSLDTDKTSDLFTGKKEEESKK